jgi:hypothetical protein
VEVLCEGRQDLRFASFISVVCVAGLARCDWGVID